MVITQAKKNIKCYAKCVLHQNSQFSYVGGNDACTYICNETAIHVLQGVLANYHDQQILQLIECAVKFGIKTDKGLGHRSCDEVHASCERFQENLRSGSLYCGKLKDPKVFVKLIDNLMEKARQKADRGELPLTCVILTKPPETILLCCDATIGAKYPVTIFDSHPRSFENGAPKNGAGFYMFSSIEGADGHLKQLFPYNEEYYSHLNENVARAHVMYEATLVELSPTAREHFVPLITNIDVPLHKPVAPLQQMVISGNVFTINNHYYSPQDDPDIKSSKEAEPSVQSAPTSLFANALNFFGGGNKPEQKTENTNAETLPNTVPAPSTNDENSRLIEENKKLQEQLATTQKEYKWLQSVLEAERDDKTKMARELMMLRSENAAYRMQFEEMSRHKHSF